jgi:hypothetical protein
MAIDYSLASLKLAASLLKKIELIVYSDFGDIRYKGCRYAAFKKWWATKVNNKETRGEYLFAEP